jgi:hypothetical protein
MRERFLDMNCFARIPSTTFCSADGQFEIFELESTPAQYVGGRGGGRTDGDPHVFTLRSALLTALLASFATAMCVVKHMC